MRKLTMLLGVGAMALAACVGHIGGDEDGDGAENDGTSTAPFTCNPEKARLTATPIRRLAKQYIENAVAELVSTLDEASRAELLAALAGRIDLIPSDAYAYYAQNDDRVTQDHVDAMFGLGLGLGVAVSGNPSFTTQILSVCGSGLDASALGDDACLVAFLEHYGRKAFRRPLTQAELDDFAAYYQDAVTQNVDVVAALLGRLVAHPNFYYRLDSAGELVGGTEGVDAVYRLDRWELLSKVTLLFWAAPPSDELYDLVEGTDITQDAELASLLDTVLADPRAERGVLGFYREWLELDKTLAPATDGNVAAVQTMLAAAGIDALPETHRDDMIQEVLDLAKHYSLASDGTLDDILTSQYSFARTTALAAIYGVAPWDGSDENLVPLPAGERSGLLTRAAMLATNAEYTRPVIKGKRIRTRLLCTPIPPPPPDLEIKPLTHEVDQTTRDAVSEATADPGCQACHHLQNPLGFVSENYDPLGRIRQKELRFVDMTGEIASELDIDTSAAVQLFEGDTTEVGDAIELGEYLADSGQVHTCMVRNYFEMVNGRAENDEADGCDLDGLRTKLAGEGGSIKAMLRESVMQQSFRQRLVK
jgi:uncharacterized protein DUF1588/uncharacterized protein DUF1592/uncharacterized protein DUF1595/uncharacterized protein DUF1585